MICEIHAHEVERRRDVVKLRLHSEVAVALAEVGEEGAFGIHPGETYQKDGRGEERRREENEKSERVRGRGGEEVTFRQFQLPGLWYSGLLRPLSPLLHPQMKPESILKG